MMRVVCDHMLDKNDKAVADDKRPAVHSNVLLGITKASLTRN